MKNQSGAVQDEEETRKLIVRLQAFYDAHSGARDAQCILDAIAELDGE